MPSNTTYVGRPSPYGNPWSHKPSRLVSDAFRVATAREAVERFREHLMATPELVELIRRELRGRNVACWCGPEGPCHGDVILEVANSEVWPWAA